ncbi:hypothetical protein KHT87_22000, partial [Alkalihalobacillus clausii]|nr:hypothetical protein [Shouchella clausii]
PKTLKTVIKDAEGRIVLSDSGGEEVERHGAQFRLRKLMPPGERYFGLGDKTGTLDRRDQTFTFWNTDNYGFGVASDPLYKSIPFVLGADQNG